MNRAVALRIAACGIMGLGAALLVAALLLTTYTKGKITKIPLDLDATLVSDGTGTAFDPASLEAERFAINKNVPLSQQQQVSVEAPSNAEVVTLQVGTTLRRSDKQKDTGLLLAIVDTVTLDRKTAMAVSEREQSRWRRAEAAHHRGGPAADQRRAATRRAGVPLPVRHREEDVPLLRPDRAEGLRRQLRRRGRRQRLDHLPLHPERRLRLRRQAGRTGQVRLALRRRRRQPGDRAGGAVGCARRSGQSRSP